MVTLRFFFFFAEDGLVRLLGRCMKKITRAGRQERRLMKCLEVKKDAPEDLKKEVRDRRNALLSSIEEVLNYQEGAEVAQEAAAAAASSDEEDAAIYPQLADLLDAAFNKLNTWKGAAVRARNSTRSEDMAALATAKSAGRQALQDLRAEMQTLEPV
ncbi:uncharacterized protein [Dermacentor andersoni]|uniref:uncharacterized protein n=1 Tax=Dermacentor andersoni TaxID=34620 RepID=UPI003B3ACB0F